MQISAPAEYDVIIVGAGPAGLCFARALAGTGLNIAVVDAKRRKEPMSMILIDLDNFKPVNDTYGHLAGDRVLKKTAHIIATYIRTKRPHYEVDFVARYGGEEFIVMVRNATLDQASGIVAERIRKAIEKERFEWEGQRITVTASFGVSTLHVDENIPDVMVRRADDALYRAKHAGKNRVCTEAETPG